MYDLSRRNGRALSRHQRALIGTRWVRCMPPARRRKDAPRGRFADIFTSAKACSGLLTEAPAIELYEGMSAHDLA